MLVKLISETEIESCPEYGVIDGMFKTGLPTFYKLNNDRREKDGYYELEEDKSVDVEKALLPIISIVGKKEVISHQELVRSYSLQNGVVKEVKSIVEKVVDDRRKM